MTARTRVSLEKVESDPFDAAKCEHGAAIALGCIHCGTAQSSLDEREIAPLPNDSEYAEYDDGAKFGRAPTAALVIGNNLGTSPGPERKKQVLSALNQGGANSRQGLDFHLASVDLLTLWKMSGDPTEHKVSEEVSSLIGKIEKKRGKIRQERLDAIAQTCKLGVKNAEKVKRLTPRQIRFFIESQFEREGLYP